MGVDEDILYGSLMGDGRLSKRGRYHERHPMGHRNYLVWKNHYLKFRLSERKNRYAFCEISSTVMDLYGTVYFDGKKSAAPLLEKLSELGLLVWYLDRGTYNYWTRRAHIDANAFNGRDRALIISWFEQRYDIRAKLGKRNIVFFPRRETDKLFDILYPLFRQYLLPDCMVYKLGHYAPENKARLEDRSKDRKAGRIVSVYVQPYLYNELMQLCKGYNREIIGILHGTFPRREITGYTLIPLPSTRQGIYGDKDAMRNVISETRGKDTCIGWFHSHVKDYDLPSTDDIDTHLQLFKGRQKYVMTIVNVGGDTMRIYDHIQRSGFYRTCQPVLNDHYTRRALPGNAVLLADLKKGLTPRQIATKYGVSAADVYSLLRRQGIPVHNA